MVKYENLEKFDMISIYIECRKNENAACNLYFQRYPERRQPNKSIFKRIELNLKNYGSFDKPRVKKYNKSNENVVIDVLACVEANPNVSSRQIEQDIDVPRRTALNILQKNKYRPYKIHINQHLYPQDFEKRRSFCRWYIEKCRDSEKFKHNVIWTDEVRITSDGLFNRHNNHHWSIENPYATTTRLRQGRFGLNVSCFLVKDRVYYYIYDDNLTANRYIEVLENNLRNVFEGIPENEHCDLWFQQDGAPAHNARIVRQYLSIRFPNRWIGTHGPINWPPRSPDITPMDFFLMGFLKEDIYKQQNGSLEELRRNTENAFRKLSRIHVRNAINSIERRCNFCIRQNGEHFQHFF
jgi:hypothetical protein